MQTLYSIASLEPDEQKDKKFASSALDNKLSHSLDLFTASILYIIRVAEYAETDAMQKASRYLQTDADQNVSTKISGNEFLQDLLSNKTFAERVKNMKADRYTDNEWIRKIYLQLIKTEKYKKYIEQPDRDLKEEKEMAQYIWENEMVKNESFQSHLSDELSGWEDDKDMILMLMDNFFKGNGKTNFKELLSAEKKEYAHALLHTVIDKSEQCMTYINPRLNSNWDPERIALIDLILLQMGVCEFLYFPTIPAKVTINEYIEIAKLYSSVQSAQFVNGVLDNVLKDLIKDNKIRKQERTGKS